MSNNMSKISKLISNIHKYGNSKLYFKTKNPRYNNVLEFLVDENGEVNIAAKLEVFDEPYWDENKINSSAKMRESIELTKFSNNDFIATVLYCSFYGSDTIITHEEKQTQVNTDKAVNTIYQIANSMLKLSNKDLTKWIQGREYCIVNMMINKAQQSIITEDMITASSAIESIENQFRDVYDRLMFTRFIYNRIDNSHTIDSYKAACDEWDALCEDDEIDEECFKTKQNRI